MTSSEYEENVDETGINDDANLTSVTGEGLEIEEIQDFARNPMMERVQRALREQLQNTYDRIKRDSLEQQQELRNAKKQREDCGVELYGMQQQLAQLQYNLDSSNVDHKDLIDDRCKGEKSLEEVKNAQLEKKRKLDELTKLISKRKEELENVLASTKQARLFNQETKNEASISKRVASKAEENVKSLQKGKLQQDLYIDSIHERVKSLEQDTNLTEKQFLIQNKLTTDADKVIKETMVDLEGLVFEKKQLVQQWDLSILALGRRDQALTAATNALRKVENSTKDRRIELIGINREIKDLNIEQETMSLTRNKLQSESKFIEEELGKIELEQESIAGRFEIISKAMSKTLEEEGTIEKVIKRKKSEIASLTQKIETVTRDRKELEERTDVHQHDQKNISQTVTNLVKKEKLVAGKIHEKEIEAANIQNEIARLRIDTLNIEAHTSRLGDRSDDEKSKLDERDDEITKLETEIRRRHNEIEGKMNKVDRLNRKYEQMLDGVEDEEPLGPLESTIKSLQKEIGAMDNGIQTQQKEWIANQTKLIKTIDVTETMESIIRQVAAKLNILKQKRLRLIQNIHTNNATLKIVQSGINSMHTDMSRLNELIGKNTLREKDFTNENSVKEMEFTHELQELEQKLEEIKSKTVHVKNAKDEILIEILDVEKQILSWEKKIHMEKEIQQTLNSSDHVDETNGMQKEINRMKHRLDCLKREQEKMLREMELAIHKKEDIAVKYQYAKSGDTGKSKVITIAELKKKRMSMMKQKQDMEEEKIKMIIQGETMNRKEQETFDQLTTISNELECLKNKNLELQHDVNFSLFDKQRVLAKCSRIQAMLRKFHALEKKEIELVDHNREQISIEKRLASAEHKMRRIKNAIEGLRLKHTKYDDVFNRIQILIDDKL